MAKAPPTLPSLETLLSTMDDIKRQRDGNQIIPPPQQMQNLTKASGSAVLTPYQMGPTLLQNQDTLLNDPKYYLGHYTNPQVGVMNRNYGMQNASDAQVIPKTHCKVFPPLLVRYNGTVDKYIGVKLLAGGEMHATQKAPDLILNFHGDSKAITATTCDVDPEKIKNFELAVWTLYAMNQPEPLTIEQFTQQYDQTRYELLQTLSRRAGEG